MERIYIYAPQRWTNTRLLRDALLALGQKTSVLRFSYRTGANADASPVNSRINWGGRHPHGAALNNDLPRNKHAELVKMHDAGVPVPPFKTGFLSMLGGGGTQGFGVGQWMPRQVRHRAASDLLEVMRMGRLAPAYDHALYVKRLNIVEEFRVHVFRTSATEMRWVSIRAGLKVPVNDAAHPWIRTLGTGWNVEYGQKCQTLLKNSPKIRAEAKNAVKALGLDFGAVDVGLLSDGGVVVLEVNTAPGLATEATAKAYAKHILARMP